MNTFCLSFSHHWVLECSKQRIFLSVKTVHFPSFEELLNFSQIACLWTFLCLDFHENQQILSKQHLGVFFRFLKTFLQNVL